MEKDSMSSIKKAIVILELLSTPPYEYTVAAISKQTGINITTIYRTIAQLEEERMVAINSETKKYRIGPHNCIPTNVITIQIVLFPRL